jgi:2-keto-4-pentenoate hydratase/2-oxohepta-3-ene-1,7-dioic acid hydratase in catechol pathway
MRFATFTVDGTQSYGAVLEDGIIDLGSAHPDWPTLREVIENDGFDALEKSTAGKAVTHPNGSFRFDIPVPRPDKILCVGVNFPDRNAEYKDGKEAPKFMSLFPRFPSSFVGHEVPLTRPKVSEQLDYEGEVVIVIGKGGRHIAEADALSHVAALSICNEGTIRDWVRHAKFNVTQGKNFDGSGAIGPWLVPFKDDSQLLDIKLETRVNGEVRQSDRSSRMIFNHAAEIAYISTFTTLVPGDMIVTGTPTGAGARFDPPVYLKPGDVVEVEVEGVGILRNGVVDEV